jgi:hypothetical protein
MALQSFMKIIEAFALEPVRRPQRLDPSVKKEKLC